MGLLSKVSPDLYRYLATSHPSWEPWACKLVACFLCLHPWPRLWGWCREHTSRTLVEEMEGAGRAETPSVSGVGILATL